MIELGRLDLIVEDRVAHLSNVNKKNLHVEAIGGRVCNGIAYS